MCVDEAGKERSALEIDHSRALRRLLRTLSDATDLPVLEQNSDAIAQRYACAVEQSPVGQPESLAPDRGIGEQCREPRRHLLRLEADSRLASEALDVDDVRENDRVAA